MDKGLFITQSRTRGGHRTIHVDGRDWLVVEVPDPVTSESTLVFTSTGFARRVRVFPPDWHKLSEDALYALSWLP